MNPVEQLGDEARALIEATRDAYEPSATNRAQVRWGVERKLSSLARLPARGRRTVLALAAAAFVLGSVGVAAAVRWRVMAPAPAPEEAVPVTVATPVEPTPTQSKPPEVDATEAVPSAAPSDSVAAAPTRRPSAANRPTGDLATETTLIARAQAATNRGQGDQALQLLDEYDRKFSQGALAEERAAARVFALCSAGNGEAARAEAARFLKRWPRSPQAARIRQACRGGVAGP